MTNALRFLLNTAPTLATTVALGLSLSAAWLLAAPPEPRDVLKAAGRGHPWVSFGDGHALAGSPGRAALAGLQGTEPRAIAASDLDEDGMPDLVIALSAPDGSGRLVVHRGNVDALFPNSDGARERRSRGAFIEEPFLEASRVLELASAPDFVLAADLDADGHVDLAVAARGGRSIQVLGGDGLGGFRAARALDVPGAITALLASDVNRRDGLGDLLVGIVTDRNEARLLVYEGPQGAAAAEPESIALPAPAQALSTGRLDEGSEIDVAVAAGSDLLVIHGRDRSISLDDEHRAAVPPARVDRRSFPFTIASLAVGDLVVDDLGGVEEIALLSTEGTIHFLGAKGGVREAVSVPGALRARGTTAAPLFLAAKVSSLPADDLLVGGETGRRLSIVTPEVAHDWKDPLERQRATARHRLAASFDSEDELVAALPMRLNSDAMKDLVLLRRGSPSPVYVMTRPMATFTVNVSTDGQDCDLDDGFCAAGPRVDNVCTGPCTFRAALMQANALGGADAIHFAIPGGGTPVLVLDSPQDWASTPMTIDATTQPGGGRVQMRGPWSVQGGNSVVRGFILTGGHAGGGAYISLSVLGNDFLEGSLIGTDPTGTAPGPQDGPSPGVGLYSTGTTIGGTVAAARNIISGNPAEGVLVDFAAGAIIRGNYIGTDVTGTAIVPNGGRGVSTNLADPGPITIGGTAAGAGNVISGNGASAPVLTKQGVFIYGQGHLVQGNRIGTNAAGTAALPNVGEGVWLESASAVTVGGTASAARNVISGNGSDGVVVRAQNSLVQGNYIGTAASGASAVANAGRGVLTYSTDNTIGGVSGGNVISGNTAGGVLVFGSVIAGNLIGTNAAGTAAVPNTGPGVEVTGSSATIIGPGNVVSGNTGNGVWLNGVEFGSGGVVKGNLIGLNAAGTAALGNGGNGILASGSNTNVEIGGTTAPDRNVISGNGGHGFLMQGGESRTRGNYIGTNAAGNAAIGNGGDGVRIESNRDFGATSVGGVAAGEGNVIANNGGTGIFLSGTIVPMRGNSLHGNGGLGIDLAPTGVTQNDACDGDSGPNTLQNFPVLTTSTASVGQGATTRIQGSLNSMASTTYVLDFYASDACDPSGFGEARTYLGSTQVTTNGSCTATIDTPLPVSVQGGQRITATATDPVGNTSELSACAAATVQYGNLNNDGAIDILDVVVQVNFVVGNLQPGVAPFLGTLQSADVNRSGAVDVFDVVLLQSFLVGNVPALPQ